MSLCGALQLNTNGDCRTTPTSAHFCSCGRSIARDKFDRKQAEQVLAKYAVLSSAWTRFKGTHFTERNRFFIAVDDLPLASEIGRGFLRKVIADVAIVRFLEVAG